MPKPSTRSPQPVHPGHGRVQPRPPRSRTTCRAWALPGRSTQRPFCEPATRDVDSMVRGASTASTSLRPGLPQGFDTGTINPSGRSSRSRASSS
jgi:hypothetical protein